MTMIEKIAKAIEGSIGSKQIAKFLAKAALEAMLEPTEEMTVGDENHYKYNCHVCGGWKEAYQTMIKQALEKQND